MRVIPSPSKLSLSSASQNVAPSLEIFSEADVNGNLAPSSSYKYMEEHLEGIRRTMLAEGITEEDLNNIRPTMPHRPPDKMTTRKLLQEYKALRNSIQEKK